MNMVARISGAVRAVEEERPRPLAFGRPPAAPVVRRFPAVGVAGVCAIHGAILLALLVFPSSFSGATQVPRMLTVKVIADPQKPEEPPPPLKFDPPPLPRPPVAIIPDIILSSPPPPVQTITVVEPPPERQRSVPAPSGFAPVSEEKQIDYAMTVMAHLQRFRMHVAGAGLRRGEKRVVLVEFAIDRRGRVLSHTVTKSSGSALLDREAGALLRRAEPLPPMPVEFPNFQMQLALPLEFTLR
jgi:protein TonB